MQAAALKQQRDLANKKLTQDAINSLSQSQQAAQSLHEQARQHDMENAQAQAMLGFKNNEVNAESVLWNAHAKALESQSALQDAQAKMLGMGANNGYSDTFQKIHSGLMAPDDAFNGFSTKNGQKAGMMNLYNQTYPGDNLTDLQANWVKKSATAQTAGGGAVQIPTAMAKGVEALSQDLATKAEKLGFTQYPLVNKGIIAVKTAQGDPAMADYLLTNMEAQKQLSQVFSAGGAPTDFAQKSASETMKPELGPNAMRQITSSTIPNMIGARLNALGTIGAANQNGTAQLPMPSQQSTTPQQAIPQSGSKINVIRKSDGQRGTIDPQDYNSNNYQIIQ